MIELEQRLMISYRLGMADSKTAGHLQHTAWHGASGHSGAHSTIQHGTRHTQHSTARHGTARHSTAQHSTAQHSTAQHSTAQHSTAQPAQPAQLDLF